jgi:hypothetical protein
MKYTKKHTKEIALNEHCKAIENRNGYYIYKNCKGGWLLTAGGMRWLGLEVETFKTNKR